jgi:hypothetical protein
MDNLVGRKFNRLLVLELFESRKVKSGSGTVLYWKCLCDCGNIKVIRGADLKCGNIKSCGCLYKERTYENLLGQRFGRYLVLEKVDKPKHLKKMKGTYWLCRCDCGNERIVIAKNLKAGTSQSCGCLAKELLRKEYGEASFNKLFCQYICGARNRKYSFELSKEEFRFLTKQNCFYCGTSPSQEQKGDNGSYFYNGIDRIDSSKGYTMDNVVPCCGRCNEAKMEVPQQDFLEWIKCVYKNIYEKEGLEK